LERLRQAGFAVSANGANARVSKYGCAAVLVDRGGELPAVVEAGALVGNEIADLVNAGFQQFFVTPSGKRFPALAQQLRALHDFQEDLKEALGSISLYNQSLGTTSEKHLYDRVQGREARH
jgi:hypothetical protein